MFRPKPAIVGAVMGIVQLPVLVVYLSNQTEEAHEYAEKLLEVHSGSSARSLPSRFRNLRQRVDDAYTWTLHKARDLRGSRAAFASEVDEAAKEEGKKKREDTFATACGS